MNTQPKAQAVEAVPKAENNRRFRELIKDNVWTQVEVLARFNKGMVRPVSMSAIKSWLSDPQSVRFRPMAAPLLAHAEKVLTRVPPKASTKKLGSKAGHPSKARMRIISRFNDYYDGVQAHGLDKGSVFKRQSESFTVSDSQPLPARAEFLQKFLAPFLPQTLKAQTRTCRALTASHGAVLFAGKIYPFAEVRAQFLSPELPTLVDHVYSLEALNAFFLAHGEDLAKKKRTIFYSRKPAKPRKAFFDLLGNTQLLPKATEMGVCIAINRRLDVDPWARVHEVVEINPRLATIDFGKSVNAWQAFQELQMFFGNIAAPERPTLSITDKDRHEQHGFDEWSFRKLPESV